MSNTSDPLQKKLWSTENVVKLGGLAAMLVGQFYLIKTEIHDHKSDDRADKTIIGFRLDALEECCKSASGKHLATKGIGGLAVLPKPLQFEESEE